MKNISRIIGLLIILSMIFTGCSNEKTKTNVIEDENEAEDSLPSVNKVYEIHNFDENSKLEKRPIGWLDDNNVINMTMDLPQKGTLTKALRVDDILNVKHFDRRMNLFMYGGDSFYDLEKYNYLTGESERVNKFKASTDFSSLQTTNGGKQKLITECNADIDFEKERVNDRSNVIKYKKLKEKGKVYIYDLKTREKKFISYIDVYFDRWGRSSWLNGGRYAIFLKDVIEDYEGSSKTLKYGIYDTEESKLIEYEYKKYKSEDSFDFMPDIKVTDEGKVFIGYEHAIEKWGYIHNDELYEIKYYDKFKIDLEFSDIIKDIDEESIIIKDDNLYIYNLADETRETLLEDYSYLHDISEDGKYIVYQKKENNEDVYIAEINNYKIVNTNLLYKLSENSRILSMIISSDNKKIVLLVNENKERIKELVIELK